MPTYEVHFPDEPERGIRVECTEHGEVEEFPAGHRKVVFYCELCSYEIELALHDMLEWRDMQEMC